MTRGYTRARVTRCPLKSQHTQRTQGRNFYALKGIRKHDPSNQAAENLRLRRHRQRDQPPLHTHTHLGICT